jgi:hypothetical protein
MLYLFHAACTCFEPVPSKQGIAYAVLNTYQLVAHVALLSNIVRFWFITLFSFSITHFSGHVKGLAGLVRTRRV